MPLFISESSGSGKDFLIEIVAGTKPKLSNQQDKLKTHRFIAGITAFSTLAQSLFKWGTICFIGYCGYLSIDSLSGKTTLANVVLNVLGSLKVNQAVAYIFGGGGCMWAIGERRLRRKRVAQLGGQIKQLESFIDKNRSSSMLPPSGTTRSDDKV